MKPCYKEYLAELYRGDCRNMSELPDGSVQCVVTSPPFWGLRKYAGDQELIWGGDKACEHQWGERIFKQHSGRGDCQKSGKYSIQEPVADMVLSDNTCQLCGAWKGAYGLEPSPDCGRPFAKLRSDLTDKEVEYVMGELKRCGLL